MDPSSEDGPGDALRQQLQPGGQRPAFEHVDPDPEPLRELVRTFTDWNFLTTLVEAHEGQRGFNPSEYAEIDARISKDSLQSSQA